METSLEQSIRRFVAFDLDGGHPVLDFTNTVGWRGTARQSDWLLEFPDLLAWGRRAGLLTEEAAGELEQRARRFPARAAEALLLARHVREVLFGLLRKLAAGQRPREEDLLEVNRHLGRAMGLVVLRPAEPPGRGLRLEVGPGCEPLERPLLLVLKAAAELLSSADMDRLKICGGEGCNWLFLDTTKNRSRRWCDMAACGNRAKARRFYRRRSQRAEASS